MAGFWKGFAVGFGATMSSYMLGEALLNGGKEIVDAQYAEERAKREAKAQAYADEMMAKMRENEEWYKQHGLTKDGKTTVPKRDPDMQKALAIYEDFLALPDNGGQLEM